MVEPQNVEHVESQLATLASWIESEKGRTYGKRDRRRFAALTTTEDATVICDPAEAIMIIQGADEPYKLSERWLTLREFQALPEFEG